jgi:SagB-type dehydrogenase family enzyme
MRYRRPSDLVCYWRAGHFLLHRFGTGQRVEASPVAVEILSFFDDWRTAADFSTAYPTRARAWVRSSLEALVTAGFLEAARASARRATPSSGGWSTWNPAAGLFHFSTRDEHSGADNASLAIASNWKRLRGSTRPSLFKQVRGTRVALPPPRASGELPDTLRARRTWRRFGAKPIASEDLSTLLSLTFGVQHLATNAEGYRFALRTAPSGGALQATEAYVIVKRVTGVKAGVYHYQPLDHTLARIRGLLPPGRVGAYLAGQWWFEPAPVLIVMSAMFSRVQWKYTSPRAYRTVLAEAGHFCQTLCLVATWLGLAPFCTQAFADSLIERDLRIDGVEESVIYVAGVGTRPARSLGPDPLRAGNLPRRRT